MGNSVLLKGGCVIDGTGKKAYPADVLVSAGKIVKIGPGLCAEDARAIDAAGLCVAPGFIDIHNHNDQYIFIDPAAPYKMFQGVTTEVSGNCGEGLAPVPEEFQKLIFDYYSTYYVDEKIFGNTTFDYYFKQVEKLPLGVNVGYLCAHGTIRMAVMGFDENHATGAQVQRMKGLLREGMEQGALGMSTGLVYSPGCFAGKEEIIELCEVVNEYGGVYTNHMRNEGHFLIESVEETIDIARKSGVSAIISHNKAMGKKNWGKTVKTLELIKAAREEGIEISYDQYPYTMSCTVLLWVIPYQYTEGGVSKLLERLADKKIRDEIRKLYFDPDEEWDNPMDNIGYDGIHILTAENVPLAEGKTLTEYAAIVDKDPLDALCDVLIESKGNSLGAFDCMCEEDIGRLMQYEECMIGSDGIPVYPGEKTHPRLCGTFPRILKKYVREEKILSLEDAVRKMTGLPAEKMKLAGKGLLKEGFDADITVFNAGTIDDRATLADPLAKPSGIEYVMVNGEIALEGGAYTGAASGRLLRKAGS
ncbi:MAG: D-aminoacylase [Clostridiales bacterium]|nr:D-aminoacylase [Clostridiales bacterium]